MEFNNLKPSHGSEQEFQKLLDRLYLDYQNEMDAMYENAASEIETAVERGWYDKRELVEQWTQTAAKRADDYYHAVRQAWQEYSGVQFPQLDSYGLVDTERALWETQTQLINDRYIGLRYRDLAGGTNKYGVTFDDLWNAMDTIDDAQQFITDMMRNAARAQTMHNMRHDPTKPRWARVPHGKTCAFCAMLASRGFAYLSDETAGKDGSRYHADCDCKIVPSWGAQTLAGYDPAKWKEIYETARDMAENAGDPVDANTILSWMRSEFPDFFRDGSVFTDPTLCLPRDSSLAKILGNRRKTVNMFLNSSKYPDTARLWVKHAQEYRIISVDFKGTAYFSPQEHGIFLNLNEVVRGVSGHRPYQVLFHETGHMLDSLLGERYGVSYSFHEMFGTSIRLEGKRLLAKEKNAIRNTVISRLQSMETDIRNNGHANNGDLVWAQQNGLYKFLFSDNAGKNSPQSLCERIQHLSKTYVVSDKQALDSIAERVHGTYKNPDLNVDDILQAALGDQYPGWCGHPPGYYDHFPAVCQEPWAEMLDAQLSNPKAYEAIMQYFPESTKIFNTMIKEAL